MYALNLGSDGRVLSATYDTYSPDGVSVIELPDGDISDYKYINGQYVYDPLPKPSEPITPPENSIESLSKKIEVLEAALMKTRR